MVELFRWFGVGVFGNMVLRRSCFCMFMDDFCVVLDLISGLINFVDIKFGDGKCLIGIKIVFLCFL